MCRSNNAPIGRIYGLYPSNYWTINPDVPPGRVVAPSQNKSRPPAAGRPCMLVNPIAVCIESWPFADRRVSDACLSMQPVGSLPARCKQADLPTRLLPDRRPTASGRATRRAVIHEQQSPRIDVLRIVAGLIPPCVLSTLRLERAGDRSDLLHKAMPRVGQIVVHQPIECILAALLACV